MGRVGAAIEIVETARRGVSWRPWSGMRPGRTAVVALLPGLGAMAIKPTSRLAAVAADNVAIVALQFEVATPVGAAGVRLLSAGACG